jgi:hypothetical protein
MRLPYWRCLIDACDGLNYDVYVKWIGNSIAAAAVSVVD